MSLDPGLSLDDDVSRHDVDAWEAAAAAVLRKAKRLSEDDPDHDVWERLARTTLDGISVTPLGTPELVADLPAPVRPTRAGAWDVRSFVAANGRRAADVNKEVLAELEGGATSIWLRVDDGDDADAMLDGVLLDLATVVVEAPESVGDADVIDATGVHLDGASDVQELAWSMWLAAGHLRQGGPADRVEFRYVATDDQLTTIAKLRAARRLWARMLELSEIDDVPQRQHVVTSTMMTSRYDPHVNLLRTTVAAFAAGVGGADAITVLPFDANRGEHSTLGRRLARNISHLLVEESHLGVVADAAGGAYVVEKLTDDMARAAWSELGLIETGGREAFEQRVADTAEERARQVATRIRPLTGLSEYPRDGESPAPQPGARSWGAAFEAMRDEPVEQPVFLATLGPLAGYTARAGFATNLLTAGGLRIDVAGPTAGVADVVEKYDGQRVVCLAGTDPTYAEWGAELVTALREAGAAWVVVAGKEGGLGVDDSARVGSDAVAFLSTVRERLS